MRGSVADDFTGATDLAGNWRSRGLRTAVLLGVPDADGPAVNKSDYDAVVVAQKIRSIEPTQAREAANEAGHYLHELGCTQIYDKYCSTFDSTPEGNIGPIADELTTITGATHAVVVPAFPDAGRTVYQGHLFVFDELLSDSPMRNHPLNPMTDSSLARLLRPQTKYPVAQIGLTEVRQGPRELQKAIKSRADESHYIVIDAIDNSDLATIAEATQDDALVTGGSGLALGLPRTDNKLAQVPKVDGRKLVLSGSASAMTQRQVRDAKNRMPFLRADIAQLIDDPQQAVERAADWVRDQWRRDPDSPALVYSVADPSDVSQARQVAKDASAQFEIFFASLADQLTDDGLGQLLVAGGETSGAVVESLGVRMLDLGEPLAPGVSWLLGTSQSGAHYNLVLKSGNFGAESLFSDAWQALDD